MTPGAGQVVNAFNSGLVTNRVAVNIASVGISGGYLLTPITTLTGAYNYNEHILRGSIRRRE